MEVRTIPSKAIRHRQTQQGFILLMTLIVLIIITIASLAMMTAMRAGVSVSGNIAFRQTAVRAADISVEEAFQWLTAQSATIANLSSDGSAANSSLGYYSTKDGGNANSCTSVPTGLTYTEFRPEWYDFTSSSCAFHTTDKVSGYDLYYVIHRMANLAGSACPAAGCMTPPSTTVDSQAGSSNAGGELSIASTSSSNMLVYYRITVKVAGPRRNNRYIQAFVY